MMIMITIKEIRRNEHTNDQTGQHELVTLSMYESFSFSIGKVRNIYSVQYINFLTMNIDTFTYTTFIGAEKRFLKISKAMHIHV